MNATNKLDAYLDSFARRLRRLTLLQGAAALAIVFVAVGGIGAWFSAESGFASTTTNVFRVLLVLSLVAVALRYMVDPLQKIKRGLSGKVEHRVPSFNGRIETYSQMKAENNPFLDLLAEDALKISDKHPVAMQVPAKEMGASGALLGLAIALLLYLLIAGPGFLNYSLRNLLAGWAFNDLLPPQSITVTPGDQSVRRGSNLRITSVMDGFDPDEAVIHILDSDGEWQEVGMAKSPLGFEFTFFSLQQDTRYYVSATGLRSPEFSVGVVDVPSIEKLELTYNFPEWTTRAPETVDRGDVDALPDTRIGLKVTTTAPLIEGQLVLNSAAETMTLSGNEATGEFTVTQEGEYYIAAVVGGEQVRLSDDYFIRLTEDGKPELEVVKPGGDYNASNIEEVLTRVEAKDDYGLQTLTLQYSVNGGKFQPINLLTEPAREITAEHMFMLEEMRTTATQAVTANVGQFNVVLSEEEQAEDAAAAPEPEQIPLQPGDLISYYAEASDRGQTIRTDMFFIQIQPYNRRYSQSQISGGGGGGGGGGGQQDEISQRQRQIIVSTWNLIREQTEGEDNGQVEINSKLLADLQNTLAEQARTLADRARARQLDNDQQIAEFVNNMDMAVQSMAPSAMNLQEVALNDAIQPAQEALQHLLRAESVFNDITVQQQQGGGGGGGGRSGQDLAEMFELEMDLSLNQYETGNQVGQQQQQQQQAEDIMKKLDELARRQEQLANNMRNNQQLTDAQRYQQEMLRREAEELQQQLEQLTRQQQANNQQGQQGQQQANNQQGQQSPGQQGQQSPGQQGQPGQPGQGGQQGGDPQQQQGESGQQGEQIAQTELQRRMESAVRAMNQAQEGLNGNLSPEEMQRAAEEASRQLQGARDQVAQQQIAGMQQAFDNMAAQSQEMTQAQERMERQLQEAAAKAVKEREDGTDPNSRGMSLQQEWDLAEEKRQLAAELQSLQQQMMNAMAEYGSEVPQARSEVERANSELSESEVQQAVSDAALYIDAGYGGLIVGYESAVTQAMRNLSDRLENAQEMVADANSQRGDTDLDRARRQVQDLREQLQQLAQGGQQPGNQPGQGQQQNQNQQGQPGQQGQGQQAQQGQPGQGQQGGQQQGNQQGGANAGGSDLFAGNRAGGAWNGFDNIFNGPIDLPDNFYNNVGEFTRQARDAVQGMDLSPEELAQIYDMLRQLESSQANRNDEILAQEYGEMLALIEQLEVGLQLDGNRNNPDNVRTAQSDAVPEEYQESVAEYFRRLSRE